MAIHPEFPKSPHEIIKPELRWFPADEALREKGYDKLLPPLVAKLRKLVEEWRNTGYEGASATSKALLNWWFKTDHPLSNADGEYLFQYYFAQRESVETIIYLYEPDSALARNFLVITPNIIVLDRIRADFDGLKIFFNDPVIPENGYAGQNWKDDFQVTLHIQDEIGTIRKTGNIFLSNIHRVYESSDVAPSFEDEDTAEYFLGRKPVGAVNESKIDLSEIVRNVDELVILNDEAHHIHDEKLAWFKSIEDIHNRLKMKGSELSLQVDVTATPRHNNGAIFVQTVSDYPLVEAIHQDVVKHPVLPDSASRAKLVEKKSSKYTEKYEDYIHLGYLEWKKVYEEHAKLGKKAVLFIMTDDTRNCDEVAAYLESRYPEFKDTALIIHTKNNGDIAESVTGKKKEELDILREAANKIDRQDNPYKVIVSVLMLKEGWDVRNVTTIVGLRPYSSASNILPEQTMGRGLRRMYRDSNLQEMVSVVGTDAFMDFVESIKSEGVELERRKMGEGSAPKMPLVVEVDKENVKKDIDKLDIRIPVLTARIYREYKNLSDLDVSNFGHAKVKIQQFSEEEKREIVFKDIATGEISHKTELDSDFVANYQSVVGYFAQVIMKELYIVETKGREDLDDPLKIARLRQWCEDVNKSQADIVCRCLYVRQEEYEKYKPKNFSDLIRVFAVKE